MTPAPASPHSLIILHSQFQAPSSLVLQPSHSMLGGEQKLVQSIHGPSKSWRFLLKSVQILISGMGFLRHFPSLWIHLQTAGSTHSPRKFLPQCGQCGTPLRRDITLCSCLNRPGRKATPGSLGATSQAPPAARQYCRPWRPRA
jgi:hypothetical protein